MKFTLLGGVGVGALLSLSGTGKEVGWGGRFFEAGRLLTFSAFRMDAYSRWALIRGGRLFEVGANSRLGAYSNKYGKL